MSRSLLCVLPLLLSSACGDPGADGTAWVDQGAPEGGDGSEQSPFQALQYALDAEGIDTIKVATGSYEAPASWTFSAALLIEGSLEGETHFTAPSGSERFSWTGGPSLTLRELYFDAGLTFAGGNLTVSGLSMSGLAGPALVLQDVTSVFSAVNVSGTTGTDELDTGDGVRIEGGSLSWDGGSAGDNAERSLAIVGANATLSGLVLDGGSRASLAVVDGAEVTATALRLGPSRVAIFISEASLTLNDSRVSEADTSGLLGGAGSDISINNSEFLACTQGHVAVLGAETSLRIEDSTFRDSEFSPCISASQAGGDVVLRNNTVMGCAGTGIALADVLGAVIEGNEVRDVLPDPMFPELAQGIGLMRADAQILGNHVHDSAGEAIALVNSSALIEGNEIGPALGPGVSIIDPGGTRTVVRDNTIEGVFAAGILLLGASADITDNRISQTVFSPEDGMGDGILFASLADADIQGNELIDNAKNGVVFMDGATGNIEGNTASGNSQYGIIEFCLGAANDVTVGANDLDGNNLGPSSLCGS